MKKFTKIFAMMLVVVMVVGMFSTVAFAAPVNSFTDAAGLTNQDNTDITTKVSASGGTAISVIKTVGFIIAIVMVFMYAIKWMMATPQKKQELKERLWYLAIGVVLLIGGPQILEWVSSAATSMTTTTP